MQLGFEGAQRRGSRSELFLEKFVLHMHIMPFPGFYRNSDNAIRFSDPIS